MKKLPVLLLLFAACSTPDYDVIIRGGTVYDGSGSKPTVTDVAIAGDTIAAIGNLQIKTAHKEINAEGKAVSPGFINMLSWATTSLIDDGKSQSDIRQGVTLEIFGEGWSEGPLNSDMKEQMLSLRDDTTKAIEWTSLGEYLEFLEEQGVSTNVASFVGATTLRIHVLGENDIDPDSEQLIEMQNLARIAMEEGAMGIGSSLIYNPAAYAETEELIALCQIAAEYDGMYISHMRSEGQRLLEAIDELIQISKVAGIGAEIYHLKASGKDNWHKMDLAIAKIDSARDAGLQISTDMYNYIAGATGLDASMPNWVQEGGYSEWAQRLRDPEIRLKVAEEMRMPGDDWENLYYAAGSAEKLLLVSFRNDSLKFLTGKTLQEAADLMNTSPEETAMSLVVADGSRVGTVYFLMTEENVKKQISLPYMSFGSDASSLAPEGDFLKSNPHPRAYGNFSRLLGKYVRDEKVITLEEAIRKLTSQPAQNLKLKKRGSLIIGNFADVNVFDPEEVSDHATFNEPHQYSTGMQHVFVNGVQVLENGEHTTRTPGRVVRGPGWLGWKK